MNSLTLKNKSYSVEQLLGYCKALTDYAVDRSDLQYDIIDNILVLAGTNNLNDWSINLNVLKVNGYHKGFYEQAIKLPVNSTIKYVTGYSLGGAVAHIYSILYGVKCISFNAPKCLAVEPTAKVKTITRFTINNDFISEIPFGFYHPLSKTYTFHGSFSNPHSIDNYIDCIRNARVLMKLSNK